MPVRQEMRGRKVANGDETEDIYDTGSEKQDQIASELLQNLSHEFRTPLNAIIGFSEMIDMEAWGPVNPKYREHTQNILEAANRLKEAVNDVLDSAKLDSGLIEVSPESFSLKSVIRSCEEKVASLLKRKNVRIINGDRNIDVILYNDRQCLEMCLCKMISSAVREAREGEQLTLSVLISSNAQVRIEVPLLGQKIPEAESETLFNKITKDPAGQSGGDFATQNHEPRNHEPRLAPGYGLSIARDLARLIGGDLKSHCDRGYVSHLVLTVGNYPQQS
ncbi:sensor histidine kinase [Luteithermobacter gelatinilyticus]|uniref:sensor histidine kinase n=1 Tax=Luteithermobacter gelatinilyticus TaxID=2582913 RepID=UPI0011069B0C|nr:HAMP domain-containing sensor histidine kinase [Luteithermobacter gelatinilyticus]